MTQHIEAMWNTLNEFVPIRREGEEIPQGFSIMWWRGPCLFYREGRQIVRMGCFVYAKDPNQKIGGYGPERKIGDVEWGEVLH